MDGLSQSRAGIHVLRLGKGDHLRLPSPREGYMYVENRAQASSAGVLESHNTKGVTGKVTLRLLLVLLKLLATPRIVLHLVLEQKK